MAHRFRELTWAVRRLAALDAHPSWGFFFLRSKISNQELWERYINYVRSAVFDELTPPHLITAMPMPSHVEECRDLQSQFEIIVRDDLVVESSSLEQARQGFVEWAANQPKPSIAFRRPRYNYFIYVNDEVLERFEKATAGKPEPDYYRDDVVVVVVSAEQHLWNPNYSDGPDPDSDEEEDGEDDIKKEMSWYKPLDPSTNDIRLVTILPGEFDDPIKIEISHAELVPPAHDDKPKRLSLKEIRETLPKGWKARETLEGRVIFSESVSSSITWIHPDPTFSREAYDPVAQEDDQPKLRYEALSYTWGSSQSPETVEVKRSHKHWRAMFTSKLCVNRNLAEAMRYLRYEDRPRVMWIDAICINQADVKERSVQVRRMGQIFSLANRVVAWLGPGFSNSELAATTLDYLAEMSSCLMTTTYGMRLVN
ncbi:hypothetical protein DL767_003569 [Monosporascus sp. MG133]|nr:hypothetical protein DL767_003569 [Monosporascus sp. MG133]